MDFSTNRICDVCDRPITNVANMSQAEVCNICDWPIANVANLASRELATFATFATFAIEKPQMLQTLQISTDQINYLFYFTAEMLKVVL